MNFQLELRRAGTRAARARAAAAQADKERDLLIRQASHHGRMPVRDIAAAVGLSHQRIAQIVNTDPLAPRRLKLHEAMAVVLQDFGGDWVPVHEVARRVTERGLYHRKDRHPIPPGQVRARAAKYGDLFDGTQDGTNRIRLRAGAS